MGEAAKRKDDEAGHLDIALYYLAQYRDRRGLPVAGPADDERLLTALVRGKLRIVGGELGIDDAEACQIIYGHNGTPINQNQTDYYLDAQRRMLCAFEELHGRGPEPDECWRIGEVFAAIARELVDIVDAIPDDEMETGLRIHYKHRLAGHIVDDQADDTE